MVLIIDEAKDVPSEPSCGAGVDVMSGAVSGAFVRADLIGERIDNDECGGADLLSSASP